MVPTSLRLIALVVTVVGTGQPVKSHPKSGAPPSGVFLLATLADWRWFYINAPSLFAPFLPRKHELAFNARRLLGNRRFSDPGDFDLIQAIALIRCGNRSDPYV